MIDKYEYKATLEITASKAYAVTITPVRSEIHQIPKTFQASGKRAIDKIMTQILQKLDKGESFPRISIEHPLDPSSRVIACEADALRATISGGFHDLEESNH